MKREILFASVLMFGMLSLVGCGRSSVVVEESKLESAEATKVIDTVNWDLYTTCVNGQEFMIMSGHKSGNLIQVLDANGYPKQCGVK